MCLNPGIRLKPLWRQHNRTYQSEPESNLVSTMGRKLEEFFLNQGVCFELFVFVFIIKLQFLFLSCSSPVQNLLLAEFCCCFVYNFTFSSFLLSQCYVSLCSSVSTVSLAVVELRVGEKC